MRELELRKKKEAWGEKESANGDLERERERSWKTRVRENKI